MTREAMTTATTLNPSRTDYDTRLLEALERELAAVGLWELLEDPSLTDILVTGAGRVAAYGFDGVRYPPDPIPWQATASILATVATLAGTRADEQHPLLSCVFPWGHLRLQATLPPVAAHPGLALRRPPQRLLSLDELVERETLPPAVAGTLAEAVLARRNLLVAGGVGSGKTTLATALLDVVLRQRPEERLVILEEGLHELHVDGPLIDRLLAAPELGIDLTVLLRHALRLNPDRIIVGEIRGREALDVLRAANTGHPGTLVTLHANSAREALTRFDDCAQEAGVPSQLPRIAATLDLVVFMEKRLPRRVVTEVAEVVGVEAATGDPELRDLYQAPATTAPAG